MQHSAKSMDVNVTGLQMQLLCSLDCHVMYIYEESVILIQILKMISKWTPAVSACGCTVCTVHECHGGVKMVCCCIGTKLQEDFSLCSKTRVVCWPQAYVIEKYMLQGSEQMSKGKLFFFFQVLSSTQQQHKALEDENDS